MSASPFVRSEAPPDRGSDGPLAVVLDTGSTSIRVGWASTIPQAWIGLSAYLAAGVALGLVLIVALALTRGETAPTAGIVTDNVVHLHARDIGGTCWKGAATNTAARVTVSMEVGVDGKVRNAIAAGESAAMRSCVESHVRAWEFLPQLATSKVLLPFEVDTR